MYFTHEYKNDIFIWLFCQVFGNRTKHKLQQKNCGSYFLNITKWSKKLKSLFLMTFIYSINANFAFIK